MIYHLFNQPVHSQEWRWNEEQYFQVPFKSNGPESQFWNQDSNSEIFVSNETAIPELRLASIAQDKPWRNLAHPGEKCSCDTPRFRKQRWDLDRNVSLLAGLYGTRT